MGKRVSYNVQGETFPTRKSLESRIRKIVASYLVGNRLNRPDTEFMLDVLRRHKDWEEKRGPGVDHIKVEREPVYKTVGLRLYRVGGDKEGIDISWREALRRTPHDEQVIRAMRAAVEDQTMEVKREYFDNRGEVVPCPVTGKDMTFLTARVHHSDIPFRKMVEDFLSLHGLVYDDVSISHDDVNYYDRFDDEEMEGRWCNYHRANADLQVISIEGHKQLHGPGA